jgi:EAL domain-containing protein (putative c-di-GMP-specific phosphodiesterase class I)
MIAVNLSPAQLAQPGFVDTIQAVLRKAELEPSRLVLEISGGVLIDEPQRALDVLTALTALGVSLAMGDFGARCTSLNDPNKFPFDKLKIRRRFIHALGSNAEIESIVQEIIAMSNILRLNVTADGVESQAQLDILRDAACTYVQGFLFGRPQTPPLRALRKDNAEAEKNATSSRPRTVSFDPVR